MAQHYSAGKFAEHVLCSALLISWVQVLESLGSYRGYSQGLTTKELGSSGPVLDGLFFPSSLVYLILLLVLS